MREIPIQSSAPKLLSPTPLSRASFPSQLLLLMLALIAVALFVAWRIPVNYPEGDFVMNVLEVAKTGHVSSNFTPDTYPYLAGVAYRAAGVRGFLMEQVLGYLLFASSLLWVLHLLTNGARFCLPTAFLCCLHPDVLLSIPKVWDTGLTCLLLMMFTGLCIAASRRASTPLLLILAAVWGFGVSVRPNFVLLILPALYLLAVARRKDWLSKIIVVAAAGIAVLLLVNRLTHGSFYVAQNGPYNFFAGANPYSKAALLHLFNAESSVPLELSSLGIHFGEQTNATYDLALRSTYTHNAWLFIRSHPIQWLWLCVIKLITLLRADTKSHVMFTPGWLVQVLTTVCVPLWCAVLAWARRLEAADKLVIVIVASYILPFLLTNADPRFRPPLDVLVLSHAASLILRKLARRDVPSVRERDGLVAREPTAMA